MAIRDGIKIRSKAMDY